ncbi:MAG: hypothetical protein A2033_09525 [Bacteroidetes bacterium GWA2_31_9]|nr:MAG: hypothetical protein A2033_09525 [Bacteroidetes bacterium GWA2_31_9]
MKTKNLTLAGLFALLLFTTSCMHPFGNCIHGSGTSVEEQRSVGNFTKITSEGSFNVFIASGNECDVVVEAPKNILDYIKTSVSNNELVIDTKRGRCIDSDDNVNIYVTVKTLEKLTLSGSGNISTDSISTTNITLNISGSGSINSELYSNYIEATVSGSGDMKLSGQNNESEMKITGSGKINAYDMPQNKVFATITGSGDIYLNVGTFLDVKITGSGDVYYIGSPQVTTHISGSGNVVSSK